MTALKIVNPDADLISLAHSGQPNYTQHHNNDLARFQPGGC